MKKIWIGLLGVVLIAGAVYATNQIGSADEKKGSNNKKQETLTVYTAIEDELVPDYLTSYKKAHPNVKINVVRDSTGVITAKLMAEGKNTKADVIWGLSASSLLTLEKKGLLARYAPKGVDQVQAGFKDASKPEKWVGVATYHTGIVVNTKELANKKLPLPESYADLTKPIYKGLIAMPNPSSSGTGFLTVSAWLQMKGAKAAWQYMENLDKNVGIYTHSGSQPAKMAGTGEYPIGITLAYSGVQQMQKGAPVQVVYAKEGLGWDVEGNSLVAKEDQSHKQLAKGFLDWALTKDVVKKAYNANGFVSIKNNYPVPNGYPKDISQLMFKDNNIQWAADHREEILKNWDTKMSQPTK